MSLTKEVTYKKKTFTKANQKIQLNYNLNNWPLMPENYWKN